VTWLDTLRRWLRLDGGHREESPLPRCLGARTAQYLGGTGEYFLEARVLLDHLLLDAVHAGASDVHLDPFEDHILARFRIDGLLHDVARLPASLKGALANRVKVMADLKIHEHRVPQDGKARMDAALGGYEMRVSLSPMVGGEKVSIRLFRPGERRFSVGSLGFDAGTLREFLRLISQPNGLFLLAGPVGSGKTTTLYTALTHLAETRGERLNITSVEDPVECTLPRVNQATVNVSQGFTYPVALRSILRHDPQVIMIGEIRDEETAGIAVRASLSGHLVLSTVHSGTAAGAFARLINLKVDAPLLASATLGVLNIRLARLNCSECAQPYEPDSKLLARLAGRDLEHASFRHGAGCATCGFTGFRGRAPLTELLVMNPELEKLVSSGASAAAIHEQALKSGMQPLAESALRRVLAGETTLEEVAGYLG
jgi:type II secretory ATPase GspE/PulE/Tfp pilus assembly ATPase PilB-like protein